MKLNIESIISGNKTLIDDDIQLAIVSDQSIFIKHSINNASLAAGSGALLGNDCYLFIFRQPVQRTLIIGTAIPIGILVTFTLMASLGLTLNIMTLGGLSFRHGIAN